jgi:hypothetical protein
MPSEPSFDPAMLDELRAVVQKAWDTLSPDQQSATSRDEVARLVMLLALSGVLDPDEIVRSIVDGTNSGEEGET